MEPPNWRGYTVVPNNSIHNNIILYNASIFFILGTSSRLYIVYNYFILLYNIIIL